MSKTLNDIEAFNDAYEEVFNPDGSIKLCGRFACIDLMNAAERVETGTYGDKTSGYLNIEAVKALRGKHYDIIWGFVDDNED